MFFVNRQADLDELLPSCRAENAKRAFGDAVACFRAGAYRACIVSTWTAVVFDYVGKLRELELAGNGEAKTILEAFEHARANHDVASSQRLEAQLLDDAASKFELLTPIEKEDLERLRNDRHRCAHPSLLTLDDPYQPSAELARCHMRNAVVHLLSRPPVQGREAWDRIWADIRSDFFPDRAEEATERLRSRLSRARPTLVRRAAIELTKELLREGEPQAHGRFLSALLAVTSFHHQEVEQLLREKLPALAEVVPDGALRLLIAYTRNVPLSWASLGASAQGRLKTFVERTTSITVLDDAAGVPALWTVVSARLPGLEAEKLAELAIATRRSECLDEVVRQFETSTRYKTFAALRKALRNEPLRPAWSADQLRRLVSALRSNRDLIDYVSFDEVAVEVLTLQGEGAAGCKAEWRAIHDALSARPLVFSVAKVRAVFPEFQAPPDSASDAARGEVSPVETLEPPPE